MVVILGKSSLFARVAHTIAVIEISFSIANPLCFSLVLVNSLMCCFIDELAAKARKLGIGHLKLRDKDIDAFIRSGIDRIENK